MESRDSGVKMFLRSFSSTALPNLAGIFLASPLERYTIICQTRGLLKSPAPYSSFPLYLKQIPSREGFLGFFRGSIIRSFHYLIGSAVTFRAYYYIHSKYKADENINPREKEIRELLGNVSCFAAAEMVAYNFERARTLVACDSAVKDAPRVYGGAFECFSHSLRHGGVKNVYAGFGLYAGNFALFLTVAAIIQEAVKEFGFGGSKGGDVVTFGLAKAFVYPLEVLRRRKQVSGTEYFLKDHPQFYVQLGEIFKNEGIRGLYRGFVPAAVHTLTCLNLIWLFSGGSFNFNSE